MAENEKMSDQWNSRFEMSEESEHKTDFGFRTKSCHSDMTLQVGGDTLHVNKAVLQMVSPVFKEMFDEKVNVEDKNDIVLDDEDVDGFIEFLACFYPSCEHEIDINNLFHILPLACKYKVERLTKKCVPLLMKSLTDNQSEEHIYQCLSVAKQHSITAVEEKCLESLIDLYKTEVHRADEILTLKEEVKPVVVSAMIPFLRSEANKYRFLSAGPEGQNKSMCLEVFQDAKYSTVQLEIYVPDDQTYPLSKTFPLTIWNVHVLVKLELVRESYRHIIISCSSNNSYIFAIKVVLKNNIPGKEDIMTQNGGYMPFNLGFTSQDLRSKGFLLNRRYTMTAHVLMNRPTTEHTV